MASMWQRWMQTAFGMEEKICGRVKGVEFCGMENGGGRKTSHTTNIKRECQRGQNELKGRYCSQGCEHEARLTVHVKCTFWTITVTKQSLLSIVLSYIVNVFNAQSNLIGRLPQFCPRGFEKPIPFSRSQNQQGNSGPGLETSNDVYLFASISTEVQDPCQKDPAVLFAAKSPAPV